MLREKLKQKILSEPTKCIAYLKELVKFNRIYDGEVWAIIMDVIKNGPDQITNRQWDVLLDKGLLPDLYVECDRCEDTIPWSEMYRAIFIARDYFCPFCRYIVNKKNVRLLD
jgi:hypothetical protein